MKNKRVLCALIVSFGLSYATTQQAQEAQPTQSPSVAAAAPVQWKPNKVLVIIGDQWADPNSEIIDGPTAEGPQVSYVKPASFGARSGEPFWRLVAFLKTYSIPFDILRLDQANLYLNYFLDHNLRPAYGAIIWDVDQDAVPPRHYEVLAQAVNEHGLSLIALYDSIKEPVIQELLGLQWARKYYHGDDAPYRVDGEHFITRGLKDAYTPPRNHGNNDMPLVTVKDATVLASQGDGPAITVREIAGKASAIWIGGEANRTLKEYPFLLQVLRRAIVHGIGYSVYKTFPKTVVFSMDDPSCTAMFERWHFPALTEMEIVDWIVTPLMERKAVLQVNMAPGRVVEGKRIVEPNWTQVYTDELGERHDLVSNGKGWRRGIEEGVVEVQSHGWTHTNPHLEAYWAGDLSYRLHPHWGSEFYDRMRNVEIPAAAQLFAMKRSMEALVQQWNRRPLYLVAGQNAESHSYANHTARLAKKAGFAMMRDYWLGPDYLINLAPYLFPPWDERNLPGLEGERPVRIGCHDFDVFKDHDYIKRRLAEFGPEHRFAGLNEVIAYLCAEVQGGTDGRICFQYHPVFCQHFNENGSTWLLHLSDKLRKELTRSGASEVVVDGKGRKVTPTEYFREVMEIALPAGVDQHTWEIKP